MLLKEEMQKKGIPMLILDGDGIDKRNSHDGQIKTRLEAFLRNVRCTEKKEETIMIGYICKYAPIEVFESMGVKMETDRAGGDQF